MAAYSFEKLAPEYQKYWQGMSVTRVQASNAQADQVIKYKSEYARVEKRTGVKWFVVGALHLREAGSPPDFKACLHNGERILGTNRKTKLVPANRGPFNGPDAFVDACYDALIVVEGLEGIKWNEKTGVARTAWLAEKFNGFGYRNGPTNYKTGQKCQPMPSPYVWGATSVQRRGKYVADRKFDPDVMDPQIGVMAVLKCVMDKDPTARFEGASPAPKPEPIPIPKPPIVTPESSTSGGLGAALVALAAYFQANAWWIIPVGIVVIIAIVVAIHHANKPKQLSPKTE